MPLFIPLYLLYMNDRHTSLSLSSPHSGINKPGGIGRIKSITKSIASDATPLLLYSVAYVLGGKEDMLLPEYVSAVQPESQQHEGQRLIKRHRRSSPSFSSSSSSSSPVPKKVKERNARTKKKAAANSNSNGRCKTTLGVSKAQRKIRSNSPSPTNTDKAPQATASPPVMWVACDACSKWRRLPPGATVPNEEGGEWFCHYRC